MCEAAPRCRAGKNAALHPIRGEGGVPSGVGVSQRIDERSLGAFQNQTSGSFSAVPINAARAVSHSICREAEGAES